MGFLIPHRKLLQHPFIRVEYEGGKPKVILVIPKTKVAPTRKQSIEGLELLGATILAQFMKKQVARLLCELTHTLHCVGSEITIIGISMYSTG